MVSLNLWSSSLESELFTHLVFFKYRLKRILPINVPFLCDFIKPLITFLNFGQFLRNAHAICPPLRTLISGWRVISLKICDQNRPLWLSIIIIGIKLAFVISRRSSSSRYSSASTSFIASLPVFLNSALTRWRLS